MNGNYGFYFKQCFGKFEGKWYLFKEFGEDFVRFDDLGNPQDGGIRALCLNDAGKFQTISVKEDQEIDFPLLPPHYRYDGHTAWWISRKPCREKEKGMSIKNLAIETPVNCFIPTRLKFASPLESHHNVLKLLNKPPKTLPITFAIRLLERGAVSVPVNSTWALSWSFNKKFDFTLFRRLKPVGLLKSNLSGVPLSSLYRQELLDVFPLITWK